MRKFRSACFLFVVLSVAIPDWIYSQDPIRFQKEVDSIVASNRSISKSNLILFTGSSSIRLWKDLKSAFPGHNVVGLGFGGSEMADLLHFTNKLIIPFTPVQVFIYEGDNDISRGRTADQILSAANSVLEIIHAKLPHTEVVFISPKPSVQRWHLKEQYEAFNKKLKAWTLNKKNTKYADVWTPMLEADGIVKKDVFKEDGLHLNERGYSIWTQVLRSHIKGFSKH